MDRQIGKIVRYDANKGFGFIRVSGEQEDVFVHLTSLPGQLPPSIGARLSFVVTDRGKGPRAEDVEYVR